MKKTLLGVVLAPVLAWVVGGLAIADPVILKGDDGFVYAKGLSPGTKYRVTDSSEALKPISATSNACGMLKIGTEKFNTSSGITVKDLSGSVVATAASLDSQKPPLCRNGVVYNPQVPGYYSFIAKGQDGNLYAWGLWQSVVYRVRNLDRPKRRVVQADACGAVRLFPSTTYPLNADDTVNVVEPAQSSVSVSSLSTVNGRVTCKDGALFPVPGTSQFKTLNSNGSFNVYLTGYQPRQNVIFSYPSVPQEVKVTSSKCGLIKLPSSRFPFGTSDKIRIVAPDGGLHASKDNFGSWVYRNPLCQNGVFYTPEQW